MELRHEDGASFALVFQVHDGEVLSNVHKSKIVFSLVCDKQPMVVESLGSCVS